MVNSFLISCLTCCCKIIKLIVNKITFIVLIGFVNNTCVFCLLFYILLINDHLMYLDYQDVQAYNKYYH